jgi:phage baseplate assembly protein W
LAANAQSTAFLGVGFAFPFAVSGGASAVAAYEEDVRQAVRIILLTGRGERLMRPDFGAGLADFVFEPINPTTTHAIATRVEEALIDWEARIDVLAVSVTADPANVSTVLIDITYRIRATNSVGNLVYPFYLGEGTTR